jgi:hypothetical protein
MHGPIKVKSPNNISKWQMGFNSAFKGLMFFNKSASRPVISDYVFNLLDIIKLANHSVVQFYDQWINDNKCDRTGNISVADQCTVRPEPQHSKLTVININGLQ